MGSKPKMEVVEYYMSIHFGICAGPVDALHEITVGDKRAWRGRARTAMIASINKPDLFGGIKKEGGLSGNVQYLPGEDTQVMPEVLATKLGRTSETCPAYRGISSIFFCGSDGGLSGRFFGLSLGTGGRGFYWTANSPYLKGVWAKISRAPVGLTPSLAMIPRGVATDIAIYFLLDRSASLSNSEFQTIKNAVLESLNDIESHLAVNPAARVDIGVRFYSNGSSAIERTNCTLSDLNAIRSFIAGAAKIAGGDVFTAMGHVLTWFQATKAVKFDKRVVIFVTDTESEDGMTAAAAGPAADMLNQNSGTFSVEKNTAVDMYAINYVSTDTRYTSLLDNTPEDGIPIISSADQSGLTDAVANGLLGRDFDANPAHIIYECLTNTDWGMGAPSVAIDVASFEAAALTLFSERLGLSLLWAQQSTVEEFVTTIINHIEATLFIHPRTGLFTLKLIRDDYDINTVPVISPSNATVENFQRKLWGETVNEIVVSWKSPDSEETETVSAQDLANIAMQGGIVSDSKNYEGVRSAELAMRLAMRDLRVASSPMIMCNATLNRQGWDIVPGSVVALHWPEHGIEKVAMRVGPVDYGRTTDSKIKLSLTEDAFGLPVGQFTPPPASEWVSPGEPPAPLAWSMMFTAPYYSIVNSGAVPSDIPETDAAPAILAAQTGSDTFAFRVIEDGDEGAELNITSRSTIQAPLAFESVSVVTVGDLSVGNGVGVGTIAVLGTSDADMEMCLVTAVSSATITMTRGILDTTPKEWPVNSPIWFLDDDALFMPTETQPIGAPVAYELLSVTSLGTLDPELATTVGATMSARPWLPSRPADVKVNGVAHGTVDADGAASVTVTWARRNRLMEDTVVLAWTDADVEPEVDQTTTVAVYTLDGLLVTSHDDMSGTTFELSATSFGPHSIGIVKVTSKLAGAESIQGHEIAVIINAGYGYSYGYNYGGA